MPHIVREFQSVWRVVTLITADLRAVSYDMHMHAVLSLCAVLFTAVTF